MRGLSQDQTNYTIQHRDRQQRNGGIRIDRNAQVVDARFRPVVGLYAAGVCTSGWDNELYGGGSCQTVGMWAGSKSARHALETLFGIKVADDWYGELEVDLSFF